MEDTRPREQRDDAPLTAWKKGDPVDQATQSLVEVKGDNIVGRAVTINKPRSELFAYWRDLTQLPTFMENVERIDVIDDHRSHWVVKAPAGKTVEWDAAITDEKQDEFIAWTSADDADVPNSGRVDFRDATGGRGTVVTATILYDPPAGLIGKVVAKLFQREPAIQARRDLRCFKQLMETGEIATAARNRAEAQEEKE
jgi:uncharacterized membrane protein